MSVHYLPRLSGRGIDNQFDDSFSPINYLAEIYPVCGITL